MPEYTCDQAQEGGGSVGSGVHWFLTPSNSQAMSTPRYRASIDPGRPSGLPWMFSCPKKAARGQNIPAGYSRHHHVETAALPYRELFRSVLNRSYMDLLSSSRILMHFKKLASQAYACLLKSRSCCVQRSVFSGKRYWIAAWVPDVWVIGLHFHAQSAA